MKQCAFVLIWLFAGFMCFAQNGFTVKTRIANPGHYPLILAYSNNNKFIRDTNYTAEDGWLVFKGSVNEPVVANLLLRGDPATTIKVGNGIIPGPTLQFVLTNEVIQIEGDGSTIYAATVKGGKANEEWSQIRAAETSMKKEDWLTTKTAYENFKPGGDSAILRNAGQVYAANAGKQRELQKKFIAANPGSVVSMYFLSGMLNDLNIDELQTAYSGLRPDFKTISYARRIVAKIDGLQTTAIGKAAVPINKKDIDGNPVNLQTLKGKYVLVDFWGSWCGPCRHSHPHLKELYAKYKDKGFEILGIAAEQGSTIEDNRRVWKDAIAKDGLPWLQVLNNEEIEKFDAVKSYGVTAFPTKILLDKDGKIIARYVGEQDAFDQKLKEFFGF